MLLFLLILFIGTAIRIQSSKHFSSRGNASKKRVCNTPTSNTVLCPRRKLLTTGVRDPVRALHGLLPHPDLHPVGADCNHLVGQLLAEPQRHPRKSGAGRHHRAHHDDAHVVHQRSLAQNFLRQVHRRLPGHMLRHGVRFPAW